MKATKLFKEGKNETLVEVNFSYSESCHNVYKTFTVYKNDNKSNIKGLTKFLTSEAPSILTANTYFWHPAMDANSRRRNEERREDEVYNFFESQGFVMQ